MHEDFTTNVRSGNNEAGLDSAGKIVKVTGYTTTQKIQKNEQGHYELNNPQQIDIDNKKCYAKKSEVLRPDGRSYFKYYIKSSSGGSIFDPWGMFSEGTQGDYVQGRGRFKWEFVEVDKKCFGFYVNFLQSRNKAWLTNAEREVR